MTNLTEQYRKGELKEGWYYVRDEAYQVYPAQYIRDYDYIKDKAYADFPNADNLVVDVLCECPKYKEWQELKELLKECKHIMAIEKDFASCHFEKHKLDELLAKMDQALQEKNNG